MADRQELENRFTYHPPNESKVELYEALRQDGHEFAKLVDQFVPDGREKALALTKIEEAVMWANAGIARSK